MDRVYVIRHAPVKDGEAFQLAENDRLCLDRLTSLILERESGRRVGILASPKTEAYQVGDRLANQLMDPTNLGIPAGTLSTTLYANHPVCEVLPCFELCEHALTAEDIKSVGAHLQKFPFLKPIIDSANAGYTTTLNRRKEALKSKLKDILTADFEFDSVSVTGTIEERRQQLVDVSKEFEEFSKSAAEGALANLGTTLDSYINLRCDPEPIMEVFNQLIDVLDAVVLITHQQPLNRVIASLMGPELVAEKGIPKPDCKYLEGYCVDYEEGSVGKLVHRLVYTTETL